MDNKITVVSQPPLGHIMQLPNGRILRVQLWHNEIKWALELPKGMNILDIGCKEGSGAIIFGTSANKVVTIDVFDSWKVKEDQFRIHWQNSSINETFNNLKSFKNIIMMVGNSYDVIPTLKDDFFDLVSIDANRSFEGLRADFLTSYPKLKSDGIFSFRDYALSQEYVEEQEDIMKQDGKDREVIRDFVDSIVIDKNRIEIIDCMGIFKKSDIDLSKKAKLEDEV